MPYPTPSTSARKLDSDSDEASSSDSGASDVEERGVDQTEGLKRKRPVKRAHKHAPTEVTSKKPVTRRRTVVEVPKLQARDPRFLPLAGELSKEDFHKNYSFLADNHITELQTLRANLKQARKRLSSAPRDLREEYEQEVGRLELAVKRAESAVNRDKREKVEETALSQVAEAEREKRKQGKRGWWMKDSAKKELLVKARYDALSSEGGRQAVKKAIEKKQRKLGQKEKKSRPFVENVQVLGGWWQFRSLFFPPHPPESHADSHEINLACVAAQPSVIGYASRNTKCLLGGAYIPQSSSPTTPRADTTTASGRGLG
ncbi:hypothetical protein ONZ45_g14558 [Pleurotus djamor]|nr:hypothetical protein ONZ45_g14558 [Pleurotus djamor]